MGKLRKSIQRMSDRLLGNGAVLGRRGRARIAVVTVVDEELNQLRPALGCTVNITATPYWVREQQSGEDYDVVLKQLADRGNLASGEGARELVEDFRPHYLLLVGIGGGMQGRDGTEVGDVVVVDYVDYYEFQKLSEGRSRVRKIPYDHPSKLLRADIAKPLVDAGNWAAAISAARPIQGQCKAIIGNLITGEKLLADGSSAVQRALLNEYDKAIAVDMEACGVARAVYAARGSVHYNLQYAIIRGVSDLVDAQDNDGMRQAWRPYAANAAATFAARMIETLLTISD